MSVTKAMLHEEVSIELENLGDCSIIFTSDKPMGEIKEKLNSKRAPYILLDLSLSYDLESVYGFLPDSQIDIIKKITNGVFSNEKPRLDKKLEDSISIESFELAAKLRDIKK